MTNLIDGVQAEFKLVSATLPASVAQGKKQSINLYHLPDQQTYLSKRH